MVTERIDDIKPLGFYIRRLCDGKETYRMQRRSVLQGVDPLHSHTRGRWGVKRRMVTFEEAEMVEELKCPKTGCEIIVLAWLLN